MTFIAEFKNGQRVKIENCKQYKRQNIDKNPIILVTCGDKNIFINPDEMLYCGDAALFSPVAPSKETTLPPANCARCGYKIHSDRISSLPSCNDCGARKTCRHAPSIGCGVRINCLLWTPESKEDTK